MEKKKEKINEKKRKIGKLKKKVILKKKTKKRGKVSKKKKKKALWITVDPQCFWVWRNSDFPTPFSYMYNNKL